MLTPFPKLKPLLVALLAVPYLVGCVVPVAPPPPPVPLPPPVVVPMVPPPVILAPRLGPHASAADVEAAPAL